MIFRRLHDIRETVNHNYTDVWSIREQLDNVKKELKEILKVADSIENGFDEVCEGDTHGISWMGLSQIQDGVDALRKIVGEDKS